MTNDTLANQTPIRELQKSPPKVFNEIVFELTGRKSKKNAHLGPAIINGAVQLTPFASKIEADFIHQTMIAGAIMIQVFDHLVEDHIQFETVLVHDRVIRELADKGFDPRVIERVRKNGLAKLEEMKVSMHDESISFALSTTKVYKSVAARSNGTQYIAALFQEHETETPSYVTEVNSALRIILDIASVAKDAKKNEPNVVLKLLKESPTDYIETASHKLLAEVQQTAMQLYYELQEDRSEHLKVYTYNLLAATLRLTDIPLIKAYISLQKKLAQKRITKTIK